MTKFGKRNAEFGVEYISMRSRVWNSSQSSRTLPLRSRTLCTPHSALRTGFTLVEMLVAVALVVLMMSLFATIFQFATASMAVQKGTAENDQKTRLVMTVMRGDLANRTMKFVLPFRANDVVDAAYRTTDRQGYFYISENDPDDDTDDVLQFTISSGTGDDALFGRARWLTGPPPPPGGGITVHPNQPEFDDGFAGVNGTGSSPNGEVSYFLRHGTLYRRVLLIRQPIVPVPAPNGVPQFGTNGAGGPIPLTEYLGAPTGTLNFWTDFDYSAHYDTASSLPQFHSVLDLNNVTGFTLFPLGKPNFRFGFNQANGLPREFTTHQVDSTGATVATPAYFGRFTHEETSFFRPGTNPLVSFGYPARVELPNAPNPYNDPAVQLTLDTRTGKIQEYTGGVRISEDLLMTGVRRFDIKVFDEGASYGADGVAGTTLDDDSNGVPNDANELGFPGSDDGDFRDLGHTGFSPAGTDIAFYSRNRADLTQTPQYCQQNPTKPNPPGANLLYRFDTWHPDLNLDGTGANDAPPFRAPDIVAPPVGTDPQRPLRAIQIRITFFDQTSQQLRDVTFVQSLIPTN